MIHKYFAISAFVLTLFTTGFGQPPREDAERLEAIKVAFITKALNLSPEEAQVFWPVYYQYQAEMKKIRKDQRHERAEAIDEFDNLSDQQAAEIIQSMLDMEQAKVDLMRKYNAQFQKVIPARKVAKLYYTERQFKALLMKELQDRREGRPQGNSGNRD